MVTRSCHFRMPLSYKTPMAEGDTGTMHEYALGPAHSSSTAVHEAPESSLDELQSQLAQAKDESGDPSDSSGNPSDDLSQADSRDTPDESQQAVEQWLRKIPDDPGGLLRRKFYYQYQRQDWPQEEAEPW